MTYTPKPGDRVTSPLLVGEWEVMFVLGQQCMVVTSGFPSSRAAVPTDSITPVAPPLPPEPAIGEVVRAHGQLWHRSGTDEWFGSDDKGLRSFQRWPDLAAADDLSPVVAVDDVAEWMYGDDEDDKFPAALIQELRDDFGGWGE